MISYLPRLYKDEIFSSFEARFHAHTLSKSVGRTRRVLYGREKIKTSLYFPTYLGTFAGRIKHLEMIDFDGLIARHTLWPLFSMFYNAKYHLRILTLMERGYFFRYNTLPASVKRDTLSLQVVPRYCPKCNMDSMNKNGEIYFNRLHQIPDITVCPYHFCFLKDSQIKNCDLKNCPMIVPSLDSCPSIKATFCDNEETNSNSRFFLPIFKSSIKPNVDYITSAKEGEKDQWSLRHSYLARKHRIMTEIMRMQMAEEKMRLFVEQLTEELNSYLED